MLGFEENIGKEEDGEYEHMVSKLCLIDEKHIPVSTLVSEKTFDNEAGRLLHKPFISQAPTHIVPVIIYQQS